MVAKWETTLQQRVEFKATDRFFHWPPQLVRVREYAVQASCLYQRAGSLRMELSNTERTPVDLVTMLPHVELNAAKDFHSFV